ncbi:MAG: hypothetical protein AAFS10_22515, partial [Myxococcota bacterium]
MKPAQHSGSRVVLRHVYLGLRVSALLVMIGVGLVFTLKPAWQQVLCERIEQVPTCTILEGPLFGRGTATTVASNHVEGVEVVQEDKDTFCVWLKTSGEPHYQLGRCSMRHEEQLDHVVHDLRSFYKGDRETFSLELSDAPMLLFFGGTIVLMALMLLVVLPITVTTIDPEAGELILFRWGLVQRHRRTLPLDAVRAWEVVPGEPGTECGLRYKLIAI